MHVGLFYRVAHVLNVTEQCWWLYYQKILTTAIILTINQDDLFDNQTINFDLVSDCK